ncbi:MAG: phage tail protein I [Spirochaetaceae bacterium]|jgi:phage tail P2-like protein|nr:phage tail protein I [Spirochaetaceae bacterium]
MDLNNISILDLMPPNLAADNNIKLMAEAFDEVLRDIIKKIPDVDIISNLVLKQIVNETLIDILAWQFHVDFYDPGLPIEVKQELVLKSLDWHYRKGTPSVLGEIVSTVFTKAKVQEWYEYGGLPYRFRIATAEEQIPDAEAVKKLMRAINSVKNTRSFLDGLTYLADYIEEVITEEKQRIQVKRDDKDYIRPRAALSLRLKNIYFNDIVAVPLVLDGAWFLDGSELLDGAGRETANELLVCGVRDTSTSGDGDNFETPAETLSVLLRKLNFLDGAWFLDGSRDLLGEIIIPLE